ncbi:hypothetical protein KIN20_016224 [Parelaphostrongylus tenuis]|uniref:Uncharacterized protein n=1 Tax=Parelaphostrongylus tenuis TaxID=148309 RepID=A0AAD5MKY0_PARTN|nr:hypothetical protein KIN20_016224 [Parelaphostrongylus tenuis]
MNSTKLKENAQQANLLLKMVSAPLNAADPDLEEKPRIRRPTKLNNEDSIAASGDEPLNEPDSKWKEWYFGQIQNLADRWHKVVEKDDLYFEE